MDRSPGLGGLASGKPSLWRPTARRGQGIGSVADGRRRELGRRVDPDRRSADVHAQGPAAEVNQVLGVRWGAAPFRRRTAPPRACGSMAVMLPGTTNAMSGTDVTSAANSLRGIAPPWTTLPFPGSL